MDRHATLFSKGLESTNNQAAYQAQIDAAPKNWKSMFEYGERGDDDLAADGVIIDQGGPGLPFSVMVPTLSEWGMIFLASLLARASILLIRRRNDYNEE